MLNHLGYCRLELSLPHVLCMYIVRKRKLRITVQVYILYVRCVVVLRSVVKGTHVIVRQLWLMFAFNFSNLRFSLHNISGCDFAHDHPKLSFRKNNYNARSN